MDNLVLSAGDGSLQACTAGISYQDKQGLPIANNYTYTLAGNLVLFTDGDFAGSAGSTLTVQERRIQDASVAWSQDIPASTHYVDPFAVLNDTVYVRQCCGTVAPMSRMRAR